MAFTSSEAAEEAFYAAFTAGDLEAMMAVWAPSPDIVCIHPGGPRLCGVEEIRRSWALILDPRQQRRAFNLRGLRVIGDAGQRVHLLEENIRIPDTSFVAPPVLATNVYRRDDDGWRMVLHHASVAPVPLAAVTPVAGTSSAGNPSRLH